MGVLNGKVAIVTGGGTGIGRGIAGRFVEEGAKVVVCGRRMEKLEETVDAVEGGRENILPVACDVTDRSSIAEAVKSCLDRFSRVDVLVNNAGVMRFDDLAGADDETYELLMRTNVWGPWRFSVEVIPHMKTNRKGSIITISSVAGLKAMQRAGLYCTSKAAVQMISQTLALEHAEDGIRVNVICPAVIEDTELSVPIVGRDGVQDFYRKLLPIHPLGRNGVPKDVADAALYLASDASSWVTGILLPVDGGRMLTSNRPKV
ncbi:MAG: SDR family oxidoreductase [Gemmatimonadota bacterium]|nr:SDR family oxidoreductase [Gemmatimonadota bacterium]